MSLPIARVTLHELYALVNIDAFITAVAALLKVRSKAEQACER
jgi:hypothetical protein